MSFNAKKTIMNYLQFKMLILQTISQIHPACDQVRCYDLNVTEFTNYLYVLKNIVAFNLSAHRFANLYKTILSYIFI